MVRTLHCLVLVASLFAFAGRAAAQDPVTQRPSASQPQLSSERAPVVPQQRPAQLIMVGEETLEGYGRLVFILKGSKVQMIDARKSSVMGQASLDGNRLSLAFGDCVYEGVVLDNEVIGHGRFTSGSNAGHTWAFRVSATK